AGCSPASSDRGRCRGFSNRRQTYGTRTWIQRVVCTTAGIDPYPNSPSDNHITRHCSSTSCGHFAFNVYGLGNVTSFAYCNHKIVPATLHKLRGRDTFLSRGKYDVCSRWLAHHCKLIMGAASDGAAGRDKDDR